MPRPRCAEASVRRSALRWSGPPDEWSCPSWCSRRSTADLQKDKVDVGAVTVLGLIGLGVIIIATIAQRTAVARLGMRSEEALYGLRVRLFEHIHRLSLADHNEERKGALVARVTSDVETLSQFFSWGALAWLFDGTLMLMVAGVMLAYDWVLALVAFATAAPLAIVLRSVQRHLVAAYDKARSRNAEVLTAVSEVVSGAETLHAYGAGRHYAKVTKRSSHERSNAFIRANIIGAFLFPSGEVFSSLTVAAVVSVGVIRGPGAGLTVGRAGRLHLLDVSVPRTDRRVHRSPRPDPDRRRGPAPRARCVGQPHRSARAGQPRHAAAGNARRQHRERHVQLPQQRRRRGASGPLRRQRPDTSRAAGGDRRRDGIRQDHARSADRPVRGSDHRHRARRWRAR